MSDTQAGEGFYAKFTSREGDQHEGRINFFKPKTKQTANKRPEWKSVKKQVFSNNSESDASTSAT